jgi:hypothetical protein
VRLPRYRLLASTIALGLALGLTACGSSKHPSDATAENNGFYVKAGDVTYQLQISRELNQYATEDSQYLTGLPAGTSQPSADQLWYGVFLWAKNDTHHAETTSDRFEIIDTQGDRYFPVHLNPTANEYAWTSQQLPPLATEPGFDSTAEFGPTQGGLVLFKLNTSVYANRPLTLEIFPPGSSKPSTISLDL